MPSLFLTAALFVALLVGGAPRAAASTPVTATGTYTALFDTHTPMGSAGGDTYSDEVFTSIYHGGLTGIAIDTDTTIAHRDGSFVGLGTEVCASCTIGGRTGTYFASFVFAGSGSGSVYSGTLLVTRATGGLAGLHGGGTFKATATALTYAYTYWFGRKG